MKKTLLNPVENINRQKSFYKKAVVSVDEYGNQWLISYNTIVAMVGKSGTCFRCWNGYSKTTLEHVKAFFGRNITKKEWDAMEILDPETGEITEPDKSAQYKVVATSGFHTFTPQARFANEQEAEILVNCLNHWPWTAWAE